MNCTYGNKIDQPLNKNILEKALELLKEPLLTPEYVSFNKDEFRNLFKQAFKTQEHIINTYAYRMNITMEDSVPSGCVRLSARVDGILCTFLYKLNIENLYERFRDDVRKLTEQFKNRSEI